MHLEPEAADLDAAVGENFTADKGSPSLSLAVDGLTDAERDAGRTLTPAEDETGRHAIEPALTMPVATLDPQIMELYDWESSLWRKIRGYLGF